MREILEKEVGKVAFKVIEGDITEEDVDAVVNAANGYLVHGGGVALAIGRAGGKIIQEESNAIVRKRGLLKTGESAITSGGNLKAKYVIHTVGPQWGEGNEEKKLKQAIVSLLEIAKDKGLNSISIPAVSCGVFGFPKELGTEIIVKTAIEFVESNESNLRELRFVGLGEEIPNLFKKALQNA